MNKATFTLTGLLLLISPVLAQQAAPEEQATTLDVPENMVYVPAGNFTMGTDSKDGSDDNQGTNTPLNSNDARPRHTASTKAFFLDKTEVTNAQYQKFIEATGVAPPPHWPNGKFLENTANWPVTHVNWYEATAYAKWVGKRLPTEIEWEKAARGTDGRIYPWGNKYSPANLNGDSANLRDVGSFPTGASPYGALDMAGNVMEWTSTWFDAYPNAPTVQPDFGKKTLKIVRGGGKMGGSLLGQTWYRSVNRPLSRTMWVGFRCVKDIE
jgi:formylglycine-generating enzyme required for sulfatase activity